MNTLDVYTRVSTQEQAKEGNSLNVQKETGKRVAKKLGLKFRLRDEHARSSTIHYREVLEQIKDDIVSGKVKNIWCIERSRMFRDMTDALLFRRDYLEKYKVNLFEGERGEEVKFDDKDAMLMYDIISRLAQYENETRTERSQRGKIAKLKDAERNNKSVYLGGSATFGYINKNKEWGINKEEAEWVQWMFNAYEKGQTTKDIKNHLDKNGVATRRTKSGLWNMVTIQKMLANRTYTGIHHVYVKKLDRTFSFKVQKIITVSQFNRVQKLLQRNRKLERFNKKHESLLGEYLVCGCGTSMGSEVKKKTRKSGEVILTRKYYCMNKSYQWRDGIDRGCDNKKSLDMDRTDNIILDRVKKVVSDSHILREKTKQSVLDSKSQIEQNIVGERERLEDKCQRIQKTIDNIENQIVELEMEKTLGKKDESVAKKIIGRFEQELITQHDEYKSVENELDALNENLVWVNWVEKFAENIEKSTKSFDDKKKFLDGLINSIRVNAEMGLNRVEKEVQTGHSFDIKFKMKVVNDKLDYIDESDKRKGYNLKYGRNILKTGLVNEVTSRAGRKWSKKKQ
jgi:DNA invertase Pin-like site-specific DNA recombinase